MKKTGIDEKILDQNVDLKNCSQNTSEKNSVEILHRNMKLGQGRYSVTESIIKRIIILM